ncbi:Stp1/IreP family PP2C-type Ser/Thr phosphatase [Actinomadura kijaniata]|uniref:Serine/threonine protein phosphatase PstP n=2 Tax=Actinomadura TaxID=1988 RepID=A0A7W3LLP3_ACTNM|nr:Stp1/IreP family PP2C-type Ser/Thr phosphatase [Actinomadura namibiensis]MBA8950419.1 protein phosphatase [Actinomadura namibiensis]
MTLGIRYAARSDVGMLREGNEDSAYAGSYLLAVADGMGGHVGGEIASAAAIDALRKLDKNLPATELLAALEKTVKAANENLHRIVESDPALQGMGTTLTAMLWAGNQVALVHIGDSRAYLLRDGSLFQITHDHTLVQSLVDEGRISPDEAASHPQRSLLLRALDGRGEVDPDLSLREARVGDRYLLCSDGLSGVVTAETIFQVLTEVADPENAVRQLIDLANRGGGPDNITCVVADVVDLGGQAPQAQAGHAVGAAANTTPPDLTGGPGGPGASDTPAGRAAQLRDTMPQPPVAVDEMPPPAPAPLHEPMAAPGVTVPDTAPGRRRRTARSGGARRWAWLAGALGVTVVGLGAVGFVALENIRSGYYVGEENGKVVLYRGTTQEIPVISLSRKADAKQQPNPSIPVADLPPVQQAAVKAKYEVKGPQAVQDLMNVVCRHAITAEGDKVVVIKGRGQNQCKPEKVMDGQLTLGELPENDQKAIRDGKLALVGRQTAEQELAKLKAHRDQCRDNPSTQGCPQPREGGGRPR